MELLTAASNGGSVDDLLADLDDMVGAMKLYGDAQKRNEVPDKISLRLVDDAIAFEKGEFEAFVLFAARGSQSRNFDHVGWAAAAKSGDVAAAKEKLDLSVCQPITPGI